jgi:FPC/CPF motif-containing protein YcgG
MTIVSPFASPAAIENSFYGRVRGGHLELDRAHPLRKLGEEIHAALRAQIHDPDFPCVGAKSIVNQEGYVFNLYPQLADEGSTAGLALDLERYIGERERLPGEFTSFIASFVEPKMRTPKDFESLLWSQLAALHALDREHYGWSETVSSDPEDKRFSFSFAGQPFFVVGLAPSSRRWARRFPWPTLVFNDHLQFERLRQEQQFDRIRQVIRDRDEKLHGSVNDVLADYGTHSEARQYAGRKVGENWRCPVSFD